MTNAPVVQGYYYIGIENATGGFGMYQASTNSGDEIYADVGDLIAACDVNESLTTDNPDWIDDEDSELVERISEVSANTYNEPEVLVAMRGFDGHVTVFGINSFDCYVQEGGEYVSVVAYSNNPEQYKLI